MPNSIRSHPNHVAQHAREYVEVTSTKDVRRSRLIRAVLSALIAGLGALSVALQGTDAVTLSEAVTALAAAVAAAGAVYGVNPSSPARTEIPTRDLQQIRDQSNGQRR